MVEVLQAAPCVLLVEDFTDFILNKDVRVSDFQFCNLVRRCIRMLSHCSLGKHFHYALSYVDQARLAYSESWKIQKQHMQAGC